MRKLSVLSLGLLCAVVLGACDQVPDPPEEVQGTGPLEVDGDPFADLPPRELPDSIESLARGDGWEITDGGVVARAGDTFELVVPSEDVPETADEGPTEIVYHLDHVEADGTLVETVDIVAVTITPGDIPTETITLPTVTDAHYELFAEVTRSDGSFTVYRDWLYAL